MSVENQTKYMFIKNEIIFSHVWSNKFILKVEKKMMMKKIVR